MSEIVIQPLATLADMMNAVALQQTYWGDSVESVVPAHMLFSIARYGGHVLAALDGDRMVGVLVGMLGTTDAGQQATADTLVVFSKRMVVLPDYRGQGIAYRLKLAQRDRAIRQGIRRVTWTFDPLLAANAHLNLRKLGAVSTKYVVNLYGEDESSGLAVLGASDRLQLDWWVGHPHVMTRAGGQRQDTTLAGYLSAGATLLNPTSWDGAFAQHPATAVEIAAGTLILVEVPLDYPAMVSANPALAQSWRQHTRAIFQTLTGVGYVVTDFVRAMHQGHERGCYVLEPDAGRFA